MARSVTPLSNNEVKQEKPKDKLYKLADGGGLQLRIMPNGSKKWLLNCFKPFTKKRTSLSLGTYQEVSILEARKKRVTSSFFINPTQKSLPYRTTKNMIIPCI